MLRAAFVLAWAVCPHVKQTNTSPLCVLGSDVPAFVASAGGVDCRYENNMNTGALSFALDHLCQRRLICVKNTFIQTTFSSNVNAWLVKGVLSGAVHVTNLQVFQHGQVVGVHYVGKLHDVPVTLRYTSRNDPVTFAPTTQFASL